MDFNSDKCMVLHFGKTHQGKAYIVNGRVQIHGSMKVALQPTASGEKGTGHTCFQWSWY